jgi:tetratricopeptide (TPR) repeat protein
MSGFNKRSRLSPSKGNDGSSSKDQPQSSSGASGQQKAPGKKLQWSMGDLLTKLDSGDGTGETVEEAMAQARAGDLQEPPPATAPMEAAKPAPTAPAAPNTSEPVPTEDPVEPALKTPEKEPIITAPPKESLAPEPKPSLPEPQSAEPILAKMPAHVPGSATESIELAENNNHQDDPVAEEWQGDLAQSNSVDETFDSAEVHSSHAESSAIPLNSEQALGNINYTYSVEPDYAAMGSQSENAEPAQEDYSAAYQDAAEMNAPAEIESYAEDVQPSEFTEDEIPLAESAETEPQYELPKVAAHDELPEAAAHDELPEAAAHDELPELAAHDELPEVAAHDELPEVAAHDELPELAAHDELPEAAAHDELPEAAAHDAPPEAAAHDELPEAAAHDELPEAAAHDEPPETAAHDELPEAAAHDEPPETAAHDELPEAAAHDELPEVAAHDELPEAAAHDELPEVAAHDEYLQTESGETAAPGEYLEIAEQTQYQENTQTESASTSIEQIAEQTDHAEPAINPETPSLEEQPTEPTKMPAGVSDDPEDTGEIPGVAFKDYMVTMKSAKSEASDAVDAAPVVGDAAGLKPEPPSAKPAFGAAAMLMKKAAEKKSEILKEKPGQTKGTPGSEDRDEPYSFTKPEFDAPEPTAGAEKAEDGSKPKFDLENETGRIDMSQLKSLPSFDSKPASPAGTSASNLASKFGRRDDETGRIDMRELMQQMPPHMAAALDKSAKSFEPGEEPQISSSAPASPPNQFNRDAILSNIKADPSSSKTNLPTKVPAEDTTGKSKKKKTKESGKPTQPGDTPQSQVVKNIQKMAPLSSMRAAEHHDLATQEVKAEHRELLNQTNQIKNKMMNVPDSGQESELERVWKQRFRATIEFAGKHQRHLVAVACVALFVVFATVVASNMAQEDLLKKIADKLQHKQYEDATNLVDRGLAQYPKNANLHFYKARLLNKGGQEDQALSEVSTAVSLDPNNLTMIEQRAKLFLEMRKFDQAIADYNRIIAPPNDANVKAYIYADLATAYIETKQFELARLYANKALKLEPNKTDYLATLAYAVAGANDFKGAIDDWTTVISKDKKDANAYAERGRAEFSNKQTASALADLAKSIAIKPNGTAYYYRGLIYLDQKKQQQAIQEFNEAIKYDSSNAVYRDTLAQLYANTGDFKQAMRNYDAVGVLQRNSDSPDVLQNRAIAEMRANRFSEAARDFERLMTVKPDATWALSLHAACCMETSEFAKAYDDYTTLIAKDPKNAMNYAKRGQVSSREKHYDLASSDFEKAIALDSKKPEIYMDRGMSSAAQGLYDQALIDLKHALTLQPDNTAARQKIHDVLEAKAKARPIGGSTSTIAASSAPAIHMTGDPVSDGYSLMSSGNLPAAIQLLAKAVVKNPNNANARRYLAYCLLDNGNTRESVAQFKALDVMGVLNSTDETKYISALEKTGNLAETSVLVARKLAIHPDSVETRIQLANLYAQLGWKPKARQVLMEGLSHSTSPGDTATLQETLNNINNSGEAAPGQPPSSQPHHRIDG